MSYFILNYLPFCIFLLCSIGLSSLIFLLSFLASTNNDDFEKLSAYECGFSPFGDTRSEFDIRFYLVAILFLIFDLEISYLFPFATCFGVVTNTAIFSMLFFLFSLTIGFYFEWQKGAFDWD